MLSGVNMNHLGISISNLSVSQQAPSKVGYKYSTQYTRGGSWTCWCGCDPLKRCPKAQEVSLGLQDEWFVKYHWHKHRRLQTHEERTLTQKFVLFYQQKVSEDKYKEKKSINKTCHVLSNRKKLLSVDHVPPNTHLAN